MRTKAPAPANRPEPNPTHSRLRPHPDSTLSTPPGPSTDGQRREKLAPAGQPIPNPPTPASSTPRGVSLTAVLLPTLGLLVTAFVGWKLWWVYRSRLFLARRTTSEPPDLARVSVKGARGELFRDFALARMAQKLRQRRTIASDRLDVPATVRNSVRKAGWLTPVPGKSLVVPEYLVLIDRASHDDHQARFFAELIDRLVADEVIVARYDFDGDPRICHPAGSAITVSTIRDLATRHPEHRLLIVSSGAGLIDPLSGELVRWADQFARWPERALLTPEPTDHWGYPELVLARHGFLVLPATGEGLTALADAFRNRVEDPEPTAPSRASPPLPQLLRERPRRWLERLEPGPGLLSELLGELRRYLGEDGYEWLAACAVYPALHWELTLDLGFSLRTAEGLRLLDPKRLAALARLPWFRHGSMPDWLRMALIRSLPRNRERAIRTSLQALLLTASQGRVEGLDLEIARQRRDILAPLAKQIFRTLRWHAPDDSPLRDHVFAACMTGRKPSPLALELPVRLGGLIGVRANPATLLMLGTLVLAIVGSLVLVPWNRPPSPGVTPMADQGKQITNSIGMKLVLIPAGEFLMGSPDSKLFSPKDDNDNEKPQHRVRITRPFYLGTTEVTQGQYRAVTGANPSDFKGSDDLPVEEVSWNDALAFCNKLSEREGLKPYYQSGAGAHSGGEGYRLPTEAEWEYACRARSTTKYSFGDDAARLGEYARYDGNSKSKTHSVGRKHPNAFSLHDMQGNVWEMVLGWVRGPILSSIARRRPARSLTGLGRAGSKVGAGAKSARAAARRTATGTRPESFRFGNLPLPPSPQSGPVVEPSRASGSLERSRPWPGKRSGRPGRRSGRRSEGEEKGARGRAPGVGFHQI